MCDQLTVCDEICTVFGCIELCGVCFEHFQRLPEGQIEEAVKCFLMGNVIWAPNSDRLIFKNPTRSFVNAKKLRFSKFVGLLTLIPC